MKVLVTGVAGFIGMYVTESLLARGDTVVGIDNLNDYYAPQLKIARLERNKLHRKFSFFQGDIADQKTIEKLFAEQRPSRVINLAAQPGVRYSLKNPYAYIQTNLVGFGNVLEACRQNGVEHLVYASSSSVYGANTRMPFSIHDNVDHPVSLYAASKKANELMAHSYSHLYGLPTTGLRYFTVYGPWGRPDMSPWLFTSAILEGRMIEVFNQGKMRRDFTFLLGYDLLSMYATGNTLNIILIPSNPFPDAHFKGSRRLKSNIPPDVVYIRIGCNYIAKLHRKKVLFRLQTNRILDSFNKCH